MNKRLRKKYLKKHNLYVNPKDTWSLDITIAEFVLPRLKLFKKVNNGYPGRDEIDTPEKWDAAIDKMIAAFQIVLDQDNMADKYWDAEITNFNKDLFEADNKIKEEGLMLFAKYLQYLWW